MKTPVDGTTDIQCLEYALGLLDEAEMAKVERRVRDERAMAERIGFYQAAATAMIPDTQVAPPPGTYDAISRRLFGEEEARRLSPRQWRNLIVIACVKVAVIAALLILLL